MRPQQRYKSILILEMIVSFHSQIWNNINRQREDEQFSDRLSCEWQQDTTAKGQVILTSVYVFTENKIKAMT